MFLELLGLVIIASLLMTAAIVFIYSLGQINGFNDAFSAFDDAYGEDDD